MMQLLGNIWVVSGHDVTHRWDASAYLIAGARPTLIDCGSRKGYAALKGSLQELGYGPRDIKTVIGTHGHWDHLSGMEQLRLESGAELYLHDADRQSVETGDGDLTASFLYDTPFPAVRVDHALHDGDVIEADSLRLRVLHTPGHTPGSVCLLTEVEGTKLLIAGDTVWGGYSPRIRSDIEDWQRSLDRLMNCDFDVITIGHWSGLIRDARSKVEKARRSFAVYYDPWFTIEDAAQ